MRENLVPRQFFFSNPDIGAVKISPDGQTISYLAPDQGVLNIWIAPLHDLNDAKVVTQDRHRGIRSYAWSYQLNTILYVQDCDGDEDWHIFKLDTDTLSVTDLTPFHKIHARIEKLSPDYPEHMLIALNNRRPDYHDIYRVDLTSGALDCVFENNDSIGLIYNDAFELKMRGCIDHAGNMVYTYHDQGLSGQTIKVDHQDVMTTQPLHFTHDGQLLYMIDSRGRNTAALTAIDQTTGQVVTICENAVVDISGTLSDRKTGIVKAVCFTYDYRKWQVIDPTWQGDFTLLSDRLSGEIDIISRCLDAIF